MATDDPDGRPDGVLLQRQHLLPGEFQASHQCAGERGPAAQPVVGSVSERWQIVDQPTAVRQRAEALGHVADRVAGLPQPEHPRTDLVGLGGRYLQGDEAGTQQVGQCPGAGGWRGRMAAGEHRLTELPLPLQPVGWENAPSLREVIRLTYAMVDAYCSSYARPPAAVTLDIDDTVDVVHGRQQLSLFNAHYDERCFLPIHVYDTATSRPVAVLLRPGKTPSGDEVRRHLARLVRRIRSHWPTTRLTIRGDGHYGRPEVMAWCEANDVDYVLGLPGNAVLRRLVEATADDVRVRRAEADAEIVRHYTETRYGAKSWDCERRVAARIEATTQGLDIRYVVTNLQERQRRMALRHALLCTRSGREPDQAAQEPACIRSHQLPLRARQSGAPRVAYRGVLADADSARCDPQNEPARERRIHDLADAPAQDRRAHY